MTLLLIIFLSYVILSLLFTVLVHTFPRNPVVDPPDWGTVEDTRIPANHGGEMEVYRITPDGPVAGTIVIAHGWGRNRDRMMNRARIFGKMGYITVLHSARDHGHSSKKLMMNSATFGDDLVTVLNWVAASPEHPVLLYGHSAGSCGAAFAAAQFPKSLKALFLEGGFPEVREARLSLYRWINPLFGYIFGPAIVTLSAFFLKIKWKEVAPCVLAKKVDCPVMVIHGALDKRFPVSFAPRLRACFSHVPTELFIAPRGGHSDSSEDPGFEEAVSGFLARHVTGNATDTH